MAGTFGLQRSVRTTNSHNHWVRNTASSIVDHVYLLHSHSTPLQQTLRLQEQLHDLFGRVPQLVLAKPLPATASGSAAVVDNKNACETWLTRDIAWLALQSSSTAAVAEPHANKTPLIKEQREQLIDGNQTLHCEFASSRLLVASVDDSMCHSTSVQAST